MNIEVSLPSGLYVVAVSGGVDSVVLLDLLRQNPNIDIIVAHFDHGIRPNSKVDRLFVQKLAKRNDLRFEYKEASLGSGASEDLARKARYGFLNEIKDKHHAKAIITAHHQDDVIETAIINMIRGTGRRGISSLRSNELIVRPLINVPKTTIIKYAKQKGLAWREDSTNTDTKYLRNYIRHQLLPRFSQDEKEKLLKLINQASLFNKEVDKELTTQLIQHLRSDQLDRDWFISLPHSIAKEIMATWLRREGLGAYDRKTLDRAVIASKTFRANTQIDLYNNYLLIVKQKHLALAVLDR